MIIIIAINNNPNANDETSVRGADILPMLLEWACAIHVE